MIIPQAEWHHWELIDPRGRDFGRYEISRVGEWFTIRHQEEGRLLVILGKPEFSRWYLDLVATQEDKE